MTVAINRILRNGDVAIASNIFYREGDNPSQITLRETG